MCTRICLVSKHFKSLSKKRLFHAEIQYLIKSICFKKNPRGSWWDGVVAVNRARQYYTTNKRIKSERKTCRVLLVKSSLPSSSYHILYILYAVVDVVHGEVLCLSDFCFVCSRGSVRDAVRLQQQEQ